jgi:23S rRNA-/tRNA-specific pseudouridylate synthase
LDRDASGILLFSLQPQSHRYLEYAFRHRRIQKSYLAVVRGRPRPGRGRIELQLRRDRSGVMRAGASGLPARTEYRIRETGADWSLLQVGCRTGRTHQIRAHLAAIGHPLLGDPTYGLPLPPLHPPRLWLHAAGLRLSRRLAQQLRAPLVLDCPLWPDLRAHLRQLRQGFTKGTTESE